MSNGVSPWLSWTGQKRPGDPLNLSSNYLFKRFRYDQSCDSKYEWDYEWPRNSHIDYPIYEEYVVPQTPYQQYNRMPVFLTPGYTTYNGDNMNMVTPNQLGILHEPHPRHHYAWPRNSYIEHPTQLHGFLPGNDEYVVPQTSYQQYNQMAVLLAPGYTTYNGENMNMVPPHQLGILHQSDSRHQLDQQNQPGPPHDKHNQPSPSHQLNTQNQPDSHYQQDALNQLCKQNKPSPPYQEGSPHQMDRLYQPDSQHQLDPQNQPGPPDEKLNQPSPSHQLGKQTQPGPPYRQGSKLQLGKQYQPHPAYQQGSLTPLGKQNQSSPPFKQGPPHQLGKQNQPSPPHQLGKQDHPGPPYQQEPQIELSQSHQSDSPHHHKMPNLCTQKILNKGPVKKSSIAVTNIEGLLLNDTALNEFKQAIDRIVREINPRIVDLTNDEVMSSLRHEVRERIFQALMSQPVISITQSEIYWIYRNVHDSNSDTELLYRVCGIKYITTIPEHDSKGCEIFKGPGSISQATLKRIEEAISTIIEFHLRHLESLTKPSVCKLKSLTFLVRDRMYKIIMNRPVASHYELLSAYTACHKITDCDYEALNDNFAEKSKIPCANTYTNQLSDTIDNRSSADQLAIFNGPKSASEETLVIITGAALLLRTFQHIKEDKHRHILIALFKKLTEVQQVGFQWEILDRLYKHFAGRLVPPENEMCEWYRKYYNHIEDYKLILYVRNSPQFKQSCVFVGLSGLNEAITEIKKSIHDSDLEKIQAVEDEIMKELTDINPTIVAFHNITIKLLVRYRIYKMCKGKPVSSDLYQLYRRDDNVKNYENLLSVVLRGKSNWICADGGDEGTKDLKFQEPRPPQPVGDCSNIDIGQDPTNQMLDITPIAPTAKPRVECFEDEIFNGPKTASKIVLRRIHNAAKKILKGMQIDSDMIAHKKSVVQCRFYKILKGLKVPKFKELLNMYQTHYNLENDDSACEAQNKEMEDSQAYCSQEFSKPLTSNESAVTEDMVSVVTVKTNPIVSDGTMNTDLITSSETNYAKLIKSDKTSNIETMLPDLNTKLMESDETIKTSPLSTPVTNAMEFISSQKTNDTELMDLYGTRNKEPKTTDNTTKTKPMESIEINNPNLIKCNETIIKAVPKENVFPIFLHPKTAEKSTLMRIDEAAGKIIKNMEIDNSQIPQAKSRVLRRFYEMLIGYPVPSCQILLMAYKRNNNFKNRKSKKKVEKSRKRKIPRNGVSNPNPSDQSASYTVKTSEVTNTNPKENKQPSSSDINPTSLTRNELLRCYSEPDSTSILWNIESATNKILGHLKKKKLLTEYHGVLATLEIRKRLHEICKRFSCLPTLGCLIHEYKVHYDMSNDNQLLEILNLHVSNLQASSVQNEGIFDVPKSFTSLNLMQINQGVDRVMNQLKVKGFPQILLVSSIVYRRFYEIFVNVQLSNKKKILKRTVREYTEKYGVVLENDKELCEILKINFESDAPSQMVTCSEITSTLPEEEILETKFESDAASQMVTCNKITSALPEEQVLKTKFESDAPSQMVTCSEITSTLPQEEILKTKFELDAPSQMVTCNKITSALLEEQILKTKFESDAPSQMVTCKDLSTIAGGSPRFRSSMVTCNKITKPLPEEEILKIKFELDTPHTSQIVICNKSTSALPKGNIRKKSHHKIYDVKSRLYILTAADAIIAQWKKFHPLAQHSELILVESKIRKRFYDLCIDIQNLPSYRKLLSMYRERYSQDLLHLRLPDVRLPNFDSNEFKVITEATFAILERMNIHHNAISDFDLTLLQWIVRERVYKICMSLKNNIQCSREIWNIYKVNYTLESDSELVCYIHLRTHSKKFATTYLRNAPSLRDSPNKSDMKIIEEGENKIIGYLQSNYKLSSQFYELFVKWVVRYRIYKIIEVDASAINRHLCDTYRLLYDLQSHKTLLENLSKGKIGKDRTLEEGNTFASSVLKTSEPTANINKEDQMMFEVSELVNKELSSLFKEIEQVYSNENLNESADVSKNQQTENELIEKQVHRAVWKNLHLILLYVENNLSSMIATNAQLCPSVEPELPESTIKCSSCQLVKLSGDPKLPRLQEMQKFLEKYKPASYQIYTEMKNTIFIDIPNENDKYELLQMKDISIDGYSITINLVPYSYLDFITKNKERNTTEEQCRMENDNQNKNADQCSVDTGRQCVVMRNNKLCEKRIESNFKSTATCENRDEYIKNTENHCDDNIRNNTIPNESALQNSIHTEELCVATVTNENVYQCSMETGKYFYVTRTDENRKECRKQTESYCDDTAKNSNGGEYSTQTENDCVTMLTNESVDQCSTKTEHNWNAARKNENVDQCIKQTENHYDATATNYNRDECRTETENHCVDMITNEGADKCTMETENHCDSTRIKEYGDKYSMEREDHCVATAINENGGECRMDTENKNITTIRKTNESLTMEAENQHYATITNENGDECRTETENHCIATITNIETENQCVGTVTNENGDERRPDNENNHVTIIRKESEDQCSMETENHCYARTNENANKCIKQTDNHCGDKSTFNNGDEHSTTTENNYIAMITKENLNQCYMETEKHCDATISNENEDHCVKEIENDCVVIVSNDNGDECTKETENNCIAAITNEVAHQCSIETNNHRDATRINENEGECRTETENHCIATITNTDEFQRNVKTENYAVTSVTSEYKNQEIDQCKIETENICVPKITNKNYLGECSEDNISYSLYKIMDELDDQLNDLFTSLKESEDIVVTKSY